MKRFATLSVALLLAACTSINPDGSKTTDFKASVDANAKMYEAQADVQFEAQKNVTACFNKASTDVQIMACSMMGQTTNFSQAMGGQPTPNRNPTTGVEGATAVGTTAVKVTGAGVVAHAVAKGVKSATDVQAKDPIVVNQPEPVIVRPEIVHSTTVVSP